MFADEVRFEVEIYDKLTKIFEVISRMPLGRLSKTFFAIYFCDFADNLTKEESTLDNTVCQVINSQFFDGGPLLGVHSPASLQEGFTF